MELASAWRSDDLRAWAPMGAPKSTKLKVFNLVFEFCWFDRLHDGRYTCTTHRAEVEGVERWVSPIVGGSSSRAFEVLE